MSRVHSVHTVLLVFGVSCLATVLISGCGGDNGGRVPVSGTVTLDGTPLASGSVAFADSKGVSAGIGIIKDGVFTVSAVADSPGIPPGQYGVAVESWKVEPGAVDANGEIGGPGESAIPEAYGDYKTSGLTATISDGGQDDLKFELKSSGP